MVSPTASATFATRAAAVARLEHPDIVPICDYGEQAHRMGDILRYLIVPDVPDGSLADYLAPGSGHVAPLLLSTAAVIGRQAAAALQHAHDAGLVTPPSTCIPCCASPSQRPNLARRARRRLGWRTLA